MIFRCSDQGCGYFGEGPRLPEFCPRCGKRMLQAAEGEMTGDDWSALGVFWISRPDGKERGLACFRRSAGMGSGWGTCNLGICMEQGIGVEADPRQAFWLYQQAVEMGEPVGRCAIWASAMSRGSAPLQTRKRRWSCSGKRRSTAPPGGRGCWPAVWNRGWDCPRTKRLPWNGCGPPALQGDASSQAELARHYEFGIGTEISPKQAVQWYRRAAQAGDADGQCCLGWLMEHGKWVEQDADGAVQLYSQAAEQGHSRAALLLGICCLNGTGMPRTQTGPGTCWSGHGSWGPSPRPASWDRCA